MIRKSDILWWVQEARKDPAGAPDLVEKLAERLVELDEQNEALRGRIIKLERGGEPASAAAPEIDALQSQVDNLQSILDGQSSAETTLVLLSDDARVLRLPLSQVRLRLRDQQAALSRSAMLSLRRMVLARPQDDILALTNQGRLIRIFLHKIPFLTTEKEWPKQPGFELAAGERLCAAAPLDHSPRFWTVVTRRGYARQFLHAQLERLIESGEPVLNSPHPRDEAVAIVDGDRGDLILLSRWGQFTRFPQFTVMGQGVQAMKLERDDEVAAALSLPQDGEILLLSAAGYAMRRDSSTLKRQSKPGGPGKAALQTFDACCLLPFVQRGKILFLTYAGKLAAVTPQRTPLQTRVGKGTQLLKLDQDPAVAVVLVPGSLL